MKARHTTERAKVTSRSALAARLRNGKNSDAPKRARAAANKLTRNIRVAFTDEGYDVLVRSQKGESGRNYVIVVVSNYFRRMGFFDRQTIMWDLANMALTGDELHFISNIFAVTPAEERA